MTRLVVCGQKFRARLARQMEEFSGLHGVVPLDPAVQQDVLAQDVYLHSRMARDFGADAVLGASGLPELQPLAGHVNGHGPLRANANVRRAGAAAPQFHEQREFLEGAVEFRVDELVDSESVQRHLFAHARPFDDEVQRLAVHPARGHFVNGAGALEPLALFLEPLARVPVFRQQIPPERQSETGQIQIAAIAGLEMEILHSHQGLGGALRRQVGRGRGWRRRGLAGGIGCALRFRCQHVAAPSVNRRADPRA